jgi:hypothetical protein
MNKGITFFSLALGRKQHGGPAHTAEMAFSRAQRNRALWPGQTWLTAAELGRSSLRWAGQAIATPRHGLGGMVRILAAASMRSVLRDTANDGLLEPLEQY